MEIPSKRPLFISVVSILALGSAVAVLFNYMLNYVPVPKEFVKNITIDTYSNFFYSYEVMRYPTDAEVTDLEEGQERIGVGVVTDPWNLRFGSIPLGSGSSRYLELMNVGEGDAQIIFRAHGNISRYVGFSKNKFVLSPRDNITIKVTFHPTLVSGAFGNFTGEIERIVKIPRYDLLYIFW